MATCVEYGVETVSGPAYVRPPLSKVRYLVHRVGGRWDAYAIGRRVGEVLSNAKAGPGTMTLSAHVTAGSPFATTRPRT